jgi:hypothetical protein
LPKSQQKASQTKPARWSDTLLSQSSFSSDSRFISYL